jgi:transcriptional regulator with XRE-family HTH domain
MEKITLKQYRQRRGLTQVDAAAQLDIAAVYVSEIERGVSQPGPKLALKIHNWSGREIGLNTLRPDIWVD